MVGFVIRSEVSVDVERSVIKVKPLKIKNVTTIYIFELVAMTHVMEYLQTNVQSFVHSIQQSNMKDVSCGLC